MKALVLVFLLSTAASAAPIDGLVMNGTTGKPQSAATVTLFRVGQNGPESIQSVKTDAEGKFHIDQELPGPRLLQAAFDGVTYNKMLPPGAPTNGVMIEVYATSKAPNAAHVDQHMMLLEPANNKLAVSESFVWANTGKTTYNDPEQGTLQFYLPPGAEDKVVVNVLAPQGMPIRRAPEKTAVPNIWKVDFPIKPGDSRVDLSYAMPFTSPGDFASKTFYKGGPTRIVTPPSVTLQGDGVQNLGQGPMSANIWGVAGDSFTVKVLGTGALRNEAAQGGEENSGQSISQILPKLYGSADPNGGLTGAVASVKWIIILAFGILALGFVLLYRAGSSEPAPVTFKGKSERSRR